MKRKKIESALWATLSLGVIGCVTFTILTIPGAHYLIPFSLIVLSWTGLYLNFRNN